MNTTLENSVQTGIFIAILIQIFSLVLMTRKGSKLKTLYYLVYLTMLLPLRIFLVPYMYIAIKDRTKIWSVIIADFCGVLMYMALYFFNLSNNLLISGALCYLFAGSFSNILYFTGKVIKHVRG